MFKRVFLFLLVNILVITTISITMNLLGIKPYLSDRGIDYQALLVFCALWGFLGALISLAMSRVMAKMMMGVKVINPNAASGAEKDLLNLVYRLAQKSGLTTMPEVGIYDSPEVNAFATGPTKSRALVAVSAGLLNEMDAPAIEGVLGHEIAHIANGDMVTMTLIQGVVNTFTMFLSRIAAWALAQVVSGDRDKDSGPSYVVYMISTIAFDILFSILGSIVVAYYSRIREFRADKGGAQFAGREKMVHALESLKGYQERIDPSQPAIASLKISSKPSGVLALFSTHPPLEVRIKALKQGI